MCRAGSARKLPTCAFMPTPSPPHWPISPLSPTVVALRRGTPSRLRGRKHVRSPAVARRRPTETTRSSVSSGRVTRQTDRSWRVARSSIRGPGRGSAGRPGGQFRQPDCPDARGAPRERRQFAAASRSIGHPGGQQAWRGLNTSPSHCGKARSIRNQTTLNDVRKIKGRPAPSMISRAN